MQLVVGRIGRAHGLRGEVTVEVRTDSPDLRFSPGAELYKKTKTTKDYEEIKNMQMEKY